MAIKRPITPGAAKIRMADLCARSEQCEYDIRQKLFKMGIQSDNISDIIAYLTQNKFIDNARFARSFARDKCRFSSWGPYKIRLGLASKRISPTDISQGLDALEENDVIEAARRVAKVKSRSLDLHGEEAREERLKLYRYILSRGFDSSLASMVTKDTINATKPGNDE